MTDSDSAAAGAPLAAVPVARLASSFVNFGISIMQFLIRLAFKLATVSPGDCLSVSRAGPGTRPKSAAGRGRGLQVGRAGGPARAAAAAVVRRRRRRRRRPTVTGGDLTRLNDSDVPVTGRGMMSGSRVRGLAAVTVCLMLGETGAWLPPAGAALKQNRPGDSSHVSIAQVRLDLARSRRLGGRLQRQCPSCQHFSFIRVQKLLQRTQPDAQ